MLSLGDKTIFMLLPIFLILVSYERNIIYIILYCIFLTSCNVLLYSPFVNILYGEIKTKAKTNAVKNLYVEECFILQL